MGVACRLSIDMPHSVVSARPYIEGRPNPFELPSLFQIGCPCVPDFFAPIVRQSTTIACMSCGRRPAARGASGRPAR